MPKAIDIIREVAKEAGVPPSVLKSRKHPRLLFDARSKVYKRLRAETSLSLTQIGIIMDRRHNTTVFHGLNAARRRKDMARIYKHRYKDKLDGDTTVPRGGTGQSSEGVQERIEREADRGGSEKEIDEIVGGEAEEGFS